MLNVSEHASYMCSSFSSDVYVCMCVMIGCWRHDGVELYFTLFSLHTISITAKDYSINKAADLA